jgi:hypothetical protein
MAAPKIQIRRSSVAGKIPTTAQLSLGELAVNTYDGTVYLKKSTDGVESVVEVGVASRNIDGGVPFSVYGGIQSIDGGGV